MTKLHNTFLAPVLSLLFCLTAPLTNAQPGQSADQGPTGIVDKPCPAPVPMSAAVHDLLYGLFMEPRTLGPADFGSLMGSEEFSKYNAANQASSRQDWPALCRYRAANNALLQSGQQARLVFMGDSITENWSLGDPDLFSNGIINRGIGGQTAPQMLLRFRADVVALKPAAVHIMAGTNDIAGNTGPSTVQDFRNNIMSMVDIARANGIAVILGSIPPAAGFNWQPELDPRPLIRELNTWLKSYAAENDLGYIDYFTALSGKAGELRAELGNDGVHPNRDGYVIMRRLVEEQLDAMNL